MSIHDRLTSAFARIRLHLTPLKVTLGVLAAGWLVIAIVIWVAIVQSGFVSVAVRSDSIPGGCIQVSIPGAFTWAALPFVPGHVWREVADEARDWLPVTRTALDELAHAPDFVLVNVETTNERVLVEKHGGHLEVRIQEPDVEIRCRVPFGALRLVLSRIQAQTAYCRSRGV
jgi:hypothetical protein